MTNYGATNGVVDLTQPREPRAADRVRQFPRETYPVPPPTPAIEPPLPTWIPDHPDEPYRPQTPPEGPPS